MSVRKKGGTFSMTIAALLIFGSGLLFGLVMPRQCKNNTREHLNEKIVLKLGHSLDTDHPVHLAMEYMNERLLEYSDGQVSIAINAGGVLGNETQMIEQVRDNSLGLCKTGLASMNSFVEAMGVFNLPYIFRDSEHCWKVLDGEIGQEILELGLDINIRGLCYYDAGSRNFYTAEKPVLSVSDLNSLKIRVQNNELAKNMVSLMGASPESIDWGELYTALQQGVVNGAENNIPSYYSSRHFEVCPHFSQNSHTRVPDMLIISDEIWGKLSSDQQHWVKQAALDSSVYQRQLWKEKTITLKQELIKSGVHFYEPDKISFREAVMPIYSSVEGTDAGKYLKLIEAVE